MQVSLRASLLSTLVRAPVKIGFDRARARELQWLFTNRRIAARRREHVLDSFWGFTEALGIAERRLEWNLPLPVEAVEYAGRIIPDAQPTLLISPCSSHALRNWRAEFYAQVADHAVGRWGMRVVLCGGPSGLERDMGEAILARTKHPPVNQIGRDTLPQMLALLAAATVLLTPDSGPAHMAAMVGTPVIGLYAPTNPARSGPYFSREWCVDRFRGGRSRVHGTRARSVAVVDQDRKTRGDGSDSPGGGDRAAGPIHAEHAERPTGAERLIPVPRPARAKSPDRLERQPVRLAAHAHHHGQRQNDIDARGPRGNLARRGLLIVRRRHQARGSSFDSAR